MRHLASMQTLQLADDNSEKQKWMKVQKRNPNQNVRGLNNYVAYMYVFLSKKHAVLKSEVEALQNVSIRFV